MTRRTRHPYPLHQERIEHQGEQIVFAYYRSPRRRTLGLTVYPDGTVMARAPLTTPLDRIRLFVAERAAWIAKAQQSFPAPQPQHGPTYASGAPFRFLGDAYRLQVEPGEETRIEIEGDILRVTVAGSFDPAAIRASLESWYGHWAREIFPTRLAACLERVQSAGIPAPAGLSIRAMTSRLGSYSYRTRRVCLNLWLLKAPLACIDYVIIHELCHARVRHHGPRFWQLVQRFEPDHARLRAELRNYLADRPD